MAELPEVAVADAAVEPQLGGIRAIAVVQLDVAMQREGVLDREVDIDRAGRHAGLACHFRTHGDPPVRPLICADHLLVQLVEVGDGPRSDGGETFADGIEREIPRAFDPEAADLVFDDFEKDDTTPAFLLRNLDLDGVETFVVIGFFQGGTRILYIVDRPVGAEERINRVADFHGSEDLRSGDAIFPNEEFACAGGAGSRPWLVGSVDRTLRRWQLAGAAGWGGSEDQLWLRPSPPRTAGVAETRVAKT